MADLISKIQFKNFEPGEFADAKKRNYEETIQLIENFPWKEQWERIVIDLTNPSITIEGTHNDYLKLGVFFNQKYVLHYFDRNQQLYTKSFSDRKDAYRFIESFFTQADFPPMDFRKENTWLKPSLKHFKTRDFIYTVTAASARNFLLRSSGMNLFFSLAMIIGFAIKGTGHIHAGGFVILLLAMFALGGGLHLVLFFNYYSYVNDKVLMMSKGNDVFYYGELQYPVKYNKKDILYYTTIRTRGSKNQFISFGIVKIEMKDSTTLKIPSLLIDYRSLEQKLFEYPGKEITRFPFLRND